MVVRLFWDGSDGAKTLWAVTQCGACRGVHRFLAEEALLAPMRCVSCGQDADLRDHLRGLMGAANVPTQPAAAE